MSSGARGRPGVGWTPRNPPPRPGLRSCQLEYFPADLCCWNVHQEDSPAGNLPPIIALPGFSGDKFLGAGMLF